MDQPGVEGDDEEPAPVVKQKQRVEYYRMVALARRQIDSVRALDPVLAALLAERGVTTAYLTNLESQLEVTLLALETRQAKMKAAQDAGVAMERAKFIVQDALGTLRIVGRTVAAEGIEGDLTQLHLNDPLPRAMDLLILQARAAFEGAQAEPYASLLATAAYPPEAVAAALTAITVLEQLERARGLAQKEAMQATENRDRVMRDLRRMVRPLRAQMRAVLRRHPEIQSFTIVPHTKAQRHEVEDGALCVLRGFVWVLCIAEFVTPWGSRVKRAAPGGGLVRPAPLTN